MNRLRELRTEANLTLRNLERYVNIRNATLSAIENGKQPFRELHVEKLTSFFDVTSDYLLGYMSNGIGVYFDGGDGDDHAFVSSGEYATLKERYETSISVVSNRVSGWVIRTKSLEISDGCSPHQVFRRIKADKRSANVSSGLLDEIALEISALDRRGLEKLLKFIREYIK